jgi:cytochrome c-type biogenesis protein CcmH/NrfG
LKASRNIYSSSIGREAQFYVDRQSGARRAFRKTYPYLGKSLLVLAVLGIASACVTTKSGGDGVVDVASSLSAGDAVVIQSGRSEPVFSARGDTAWIQANTKSDSVLRRAEGALASGEGSQAEDLARDYLQQHPGDATGLLYLANALVVQQKYQLAAYYAGLGLRAAPGDANLVNIQALSVYMNSNGHMDDIQKAERMFTEAINSSSQQVAAGLNLGRLYMAIGKADRAAEVFQTVRNRCNCVAGWLGEGVANIRLKKFSAANYALDQAHRIAPRDPVVMYQVALVRRAGYNDKVGATRSLETVLASNDPKYRNLREKAQSMLRQIRGEAELDERIAAGKVSSKKATVAAEQAPDKELVNDLSSPD